MIRCECLPMVGVCWLRFWGHSAKNFKWEKPFCRPAVDSSGATRRHRPTVSCFNNFRVVANWTAGSRALPETDYKPYIRNTPNYLQV